MMLVRNARLERNTEGLLKSDKYFRVIGFVCGVVLSNFTKIGLQEIVKSRVVYAE